MSESGGTARLRQKIYANTDATVNLLCRPLGDRPLYRDEADEAESALENELDALDRLLASIDRARLMAQPDDLGDRMPGGTWSAVLDAARRVELGGEG